MKRFSIFLGLVLTILLVVIFIVDWDSYKEKILLNRLALISAKKSFGTSFPNNLDQQSGLSIQPDNCRYYWFQGFADHFNGNVSERNENWLKAIQCDPGLVLLLHGLYPEDLELAQMVLRAQPESAEAWFWLGDMIPERKIEYYQRGLALDPTDGRRWLVLGSMLKRIDLQAALQAYLQACYNGDPGANGCLGAGSIAEQLGDPETAILYYRMSRWAPARQKGDELEQQLSRQGQP